MCVLWSSYHIYVKGLILNMLQDHVTFFNCAVYIFIFVCVNVIRQKHGTTELVFACRRPRRWVLSVLSTLTSL